MRISKILYLVDKLPDEREKVIILELSQQFQQIDDKQLDND